MKRIVYLLVAVVLLASCKKKYCWECTETNTTYKYAKASSGNVDYPKVTDTIVKNSPVYTSATNTCDKTRDEIEDLMQQGTYTNDGIDNVQDSFHTTVVTNCNKL